MAGYSEKDIDTEEDSQWKPPTEAEKKVLQARRDRSDRISKIMGGYLLKGYKMLASECKRCGTIELQDRKNKIYCVACEEIDPEIKKDSPALNEKAATSQRAEQQFLTERHIDSSFGTSSALQAVSVTDLHQSLAAVSLSNKSHTVKSTLGLEEECTKCVDAVHKKMTWARMMLETENDPVTITSYLRVITSCVESIAALKKFNA